MGPLKSFKRAKLILEITDEDKWEYDETTMVKEF